MGRDVTLYGGRHEIQTARIVLEDGKLFLLNEDGERIASARMPGAGPMLAKLAWSRGATRVEHSYDLARDEIR